LLLSRSCGIISSTVSGGHTGQQLHFGEFILDQSRYRLQRGDRVLRLEKLPMELLLFLIERRGELVSREEIVAHLWGKDVFLDTDHSINTAVRKIRQVLSDDPEKPRYVETIVGKGYRFAAAVTVNGDSPQVAPAAGPASQVVWSEQVLPLRHRTSSARISRFFAAGAVLVVLCLLGFYLLRSRATKASVNSPIRSLAVLPLDNLSGDSGEQYLADGMTEELIGRLAGIRDLRVISRTSVMRFRDTKLSVPEIARMLNVDAIVEGSVIRDGNVVRVHAQLIRGATDTHIWAASYDRSLRDVLALESDLAQAIAAKVEASVTGEERNRLSLSRNVSPEGYESYLKGRFINGNSRSDVEKSISYFQDAIRRDPAFAPAYVGLAESYQKMATVFIGARAEDVRPQVVAASQKALELDSSLGEAHALLADIYQKEWRWNDAEAEYKRALALNPNDAVTRLNYANWLVCRGRPDEAVSLAQSALELDPLGESAAQIGWILFQAHRFDEAQRQLQSILGVHPDDATALWYLGFVLTANGHSQDAVPVLEKAVSLSNRSPAVLAILIRAYAQSGKRQEAVSLLAEIKQQRKLGYVPAGAFVNAYLALGDNDKALEFLQQAFKEHSNILQYLNVHPFFEPVRNDLRFKDLVRRVGLNQDQTGRNHGP
jgi:TolB-like protein/DNA-binding winged helix-turn-helix (wHTH) protein/Tfp pilus assembly protein PilF